MIINHFVLLRNLMTFLTDLHFIYQSLTYYHIFLEKNRLLVIVVKMNWFIVIVSLRFFQQSTIT